MELNSADGAAGRRSATSDATGRYEISALAAGRFQLRVSKTGLASVEYGQSRSLQQGRIITVAEGQRVQRIDVTMPRGGAVTGAVVDGSGEPFEGIGVQVWQARFLDGRTTLASVGGVQSRRTDDRGRYRLYGLLPGTYYIVATGEASGARGGGPGRGGRGGPGRAWFPGLRVFYPGTTALTEAAPVQLEVGRMSRGPTSCLPRHVRRRCAVRRGTREANRPEAGRFSP